MTTTTLERPEIGRRVYYGWVVLGVAALAMVGTLPGRTQGLGLITEPLLRDAGIDRVRFAEINLVATLTGLAGNFGAGAWADRGSLRRVLIAAMLLLTVALIALPHVKTTAHVYGQAVAMGVAGGFVTVVFFSFWGRAYGRTHLGRIQGVAQALTVFASATGPLFFAWCVDMTGSYATAFYLLAAVMVALAIAAMIVRVPATAERAAA